MQRSGTSPRPFRVLGLQQVAIGAPDRARLSHLWVDLLGLSVERTHRNERENVDEAVLRLGTGDEAVEIDLMQPIDPQARPRVHEPPLNHIGLWVDDLAAAVAWLSAQGVRFAPGGIRKGAAGYDVCFIHPKGAPDAPQGGEGVLIELVQAPPERVAAVSGAPAPPVRPDPAGGPSPRRPLYPPIEPYDTGYLDVGDGHRIYYEQSGNPKGKPVVFLHGGPGGGTEPKHRCYFDPERYRIVLFDQRGCGRSRPHAELRENHTWALVEDIERLRKHLGIERWQVFGGSWGSTLAVAYGMSHPDRVTEFVLRGIFLFLPDEVDWFYRTGTRHMFPEAYEAFLAPLAPDERDDPIAAYHRRLTSDDPEVRTRAAETWSAWECTVATLLPDPALVAYCRNPEFSLAFARIECHYFVHGGFLDTPTQLLDGVPAIAHIPCTIVHGRYDVICPVRNAHRLHRAWPGSKLVVVPDAGHSASEPGVVDALVRATDAYAGRS